MKQTSMLPPLLLLVLTTTTIVISQSNPNNEVALIVNGVQPKSNVTCLCTEDEMCEGNTRTCTLKNPDQTCYESWTLDSQDNSIRVTAGCIFNDFFFIRLMCDRNDTSRYIVCCSQRDYCNDLDAYSKSIREAMLLPLSKNNPSDSIVRPPSRKVTLAIFIITGVVTLMIALIGVCLFIYFRQAKKQGKEKDHQKVPTYGNVETKKTFIQRLLKHLSLGNNPPDDDRERRNPEDQSLVGLLDISISTLGPALPLLMQRTLARQITLGELIGAGRYGSVHRGSWREDNVAVKIFSANDERSWFREIDIYQTVCLRHENILGFIAADNMDASTHTQLWLVTEYHENGSLYDYLMNHTVTIPVLVKMMLTIASGLCHLHMPIDCTNGKVALAHRDLKTKNILVKKDLSCCIADLGLAVKEVRTAPKSRGYGYPAKQPPREQVVIDIQANSRVGTLRYMAPEVIDETINVKSFESYKAADMYALGLAYWEMLRRCQTKPLEDDADTFQVPYEDVLPNNPSVDLMRDVVCTRKIRPTPSARWQTHPVLHQIARLCEELWIEDPACRLTSINVKKQLKTHSDLIERELANTNTDSQQQSTANNGPWTA